MDGFAANGGHTAMLYYDETTLPYYYALASEFAIADRWFASVPGPTFPNRMFMVSASSFGHIRNDPPPRRAAELSVFDQLENAGLSWGIFSSSTPSLEERLLPGLREKKDTQFQGIDDFEKAAKAGTLPAFSWVTSAEEQNEHPPKNIQAGQRFVAVSSMQSPAARTGHARHYS
jgi:phospholipase C